MNEPLLVPPLYWDGKAYYLNNFQTGVYNYEGWVKATPEMLTAALKSKKQEEVKTVTSLTQILAVYRSLDPARLLLAFQLTKETGRNDHEVTLQGRANINDVIGSDLPPSPLAELRDEGVLPSEFSIELVVTTEGRPLELRTKRPGDAEQVTYSWSSVASGPTVPSAAVDMSRILSTPAGGSLLQETTSTERQ